MRLDTTPPSVAVVQPAAGAQYVHSATLLAKLDAASMRRNAGDCGAASNIYGALINELQGQSGKGIDAAAAQIVIRDAQYLIGHCPS